MSISIIPPEILRIIIEYSLDFHSYKSLRAISRDFHQIIAEKIPQPTHDTYEYPGKLVRYNPIGFLHGIQIKVCPEFIAYEKYDCGIKISRIIHEIPKNSYVHPSVFDISDDIYKQLEVANGMIVVKYPKSAEVHRYSPPGFYRRIAGDFLVEFTPIMLIGICGLCTGYLKSIF